MATIKKQATKKVAQKKEAVKPNARLSKKAIDSNTVKNAGGKVNKTTPNAGTGKNITEHNKKAQDELRTKARKQAMIDALKQTLGIVSTACNIAGVGRTQHYEWYNNDPAYREEVDAVAEMTLDFAESSLMKQIKSENTAATIFYLKTKGKKRGYIETNVNLNKDITDLSDMTDDELDALIAQGK